MTTDAGASSERIAYRAARRAYEAGRLRAAALRGAAVAAAAGVLTVLVPGPRAIAWLPLTWLVVAFAEWRGLSLAKGARRGVLAGAATLFLPVTLLRTCCAADAAMDGACCARPEACVAAGLLVGLVLAAGLPVRGGSRVQAAIGMAAGMLAVASLRCGGLVLGEALGLLGGLAAGVAVAGVASSLLDLRARPDERARRSRPSERADGDRCGSDGVAARSSARALATAAPPRRSGSPAAPPRRAR
jgi:hypothetical protein